MTCSSKIPVLAFADSHIPYLELDMHSQLNIKFCTDLDNFFEEALSNNFSGMILEMKKVMNTPVRERNKIFSLVADKPLMRTKTKREQAVLVDDPTCFHNDCRKNRANNIRRYERATVNLQIQVSHEDDHVMAHEFYASAINLSEAGCFIRTQTDLSQNKFIHLKFHDISNKLPIYGAIRWMAKPKNGFYGYGLQFISIHEDQRHELVEHHILPNINKKPSPAPAKAAAQ